MVKKILALAVGLSLAGQAMAKEVEGYFLFCSSAADCTFMVKEKPFPAAEPEDADEVKYWLERRGLKPETGISYYGIRVQVRGIDAPRTATRWLDPGLPEQAYSRCDLEYELGMKALFKLGEKLLGAKKIFLKDLEINPAGGDPKYSTEHESTEGGYIATLLVGAKREDATKDLLNQGLVWRKGAGGEWCNKKEQSMN